MLATSIALTIAAVLIECIIVYKYPVILEQFKKNMLVGIGFSIGLSWVLGYVFGAAGMIVMFAAIASTVITAIIYKLKILSGIRWVSNLFAKSEKNEVIR